MENTSQESKGLSNKAIIVPIVVIITVVVLLIIGGQKHRFKPVLEGEAAPAFTVSDLKGNTVQLSDYKGKVVFLNFWATWCKPCEEEIPSMEVMYAVRKDNYRIAAQWPFIA